MEKIEKVKLALLDYDITAHSYIHKEAARETVDLLPLLPPSGYSNFLKNGPLDLSETSASQRKEYNPATRCRKVLNSKNLSSCRGHKF